MKSVRTILLSAVAALGLASPGLADEGVGEWTRGWIAQSYAVKVGGDAPKPTDLLLNTWLDTGKGLFTTDYLFAFDSQRTFIFNAGILRSGALKIEQPGTYRLHIYSDRYLGSGTPECRARVALDGATVLDSTAKFTERKSGSLAANEVTEARQFHEAQQGASPVLQVTEPGYYRIDFWSVCRDLNAKQAVYNLSNELGNRKEKAGMFGSKLWRVESFYNGDAQVLEAQKHRMNTNSIKQIIAENHSTMFDLVLENLVTGEKGRINGQNIWHQSSHSPVERLEFQALSPSGEGSFTASPWVFTGIRGDLKASYVQESGYSPAFRTAATRMPFVVNQLEARKRITISEAGKYDIALGYEPKMSASDFMTDKKRGPRGGQVMTNPESERLAIFIERRLADGRVKRLKLYEGVLIGSNLVGELEFMRINFQEGDYDLAITKSAASIVRGRYGDIDIAKSFTNSQMSLRMKRIDEAGFRLVN